IEGVGVAVSGKAVNVAVTVGNCASVGSAAESSGGGESQAAANHNTLSSASPHITAVFFSVPVGRKFW
ncbi:MAG: hypothetical protein K8I60_20340, partial [Anaerolineae bacterium]|nr:hypothetical protein [Anaerolineae bacterium]